MHNFFYCFKFYTFASVTKFYTFASVTVDQALEHLLVRGHLLVISPMQQGQQVAIFILVWLQFDYKSEKQVVSRVVAPKVGKSSYKLLSLVQGTNKAQELSLKRGLKFLLSSSTFQYGYLAMTFEMLFRRVKRN